MRIGTLSDLHIDRNKDILQAGESFISQIRELINEKEIDTLLIAGDVSNHYLETHDFLKELEEKANIPVLFVPGNHDYWAKDHNITDTKELDAFFNDQDYAVVGKPHLLNEDWAVVGTPGWYDYGYGNHDKYTTQKFSRKQYGFASWNDKHYVQWHKSDKEVSSDMLEQLSKDLESVGERNVILMTHVATHKEFVIPLPHRVYNYANAFLGAKKYEQLYEWFPNIKYSIMGHVHLRKAVRNDQRTFIASCLGTSKHWRDKNLKRQLEKSLLTFDII